MDILFAPLAQLDRACGYGPQGWGFKSLRAHQRLVLMGAVEPPFLLEVFLEENEKYMRMALKEAEKAGLKGEVPVGCVIVMDGRVIARGHNLRESKNDPVAHAEIVALRRAGRKLGSWRLERAIVYVSCEPCAMCAGALVLARVKKVVYGCKDLKAGAVHSVYGIGTDGLLNHRFEVEAGVLEGECQLLLSRFFKKLRKKL